MAGQIKVKEVNLERGFPTVDLAVREMIGHLGTCKRQGYRAVILIHGYGSSGSGGGIKTAVRGKLRDGSLRGMIKAWCGGEEWADRREPFVKDCVQIKDFEPRISGNAGVTVVLLK